MTAPVLLPLNSQKRTSCDTEMACEKIAKAPESRNPVTSNENLLLTLAPRVVFIFVSAAIPLLSAGSVLPQPPAAVYADTETTTNIPIVVDFNRFDRLHFTIELDASPTNSLQVAIGTDADGDGNLSMDEEALAFGYDCGTWFERDAADDSFESETAALSGRFFREVKLRKRKIDTSWNLIKVTRRGYGELNESAVVEEKVARFIFGVR